MQLIKPSRYIHILKYTHNFIFIKTLLINSKTNRIFKYEEKVMDYQDIMNFVKILKKQNKKLEKKIKEMENIWIKVKQLK